MDKKKKTVVEDMASDNAATVQAKPSKAVMMSQAVTLINSMSGDEINKLLSVLQQSSQTAAASIPNDAAAKNAASIAAKGLAAEELTDIFGGEELTEEFKEKVSTLFEAAVHTQVQLKLNEAEEKFQGLLEEQVTAIVDELTEQVDKYLSYVADEWMKENEVAIESSLRTEIAEQFIEGLKALFVENYIEIPEDKVDVLENYAAKVDELEEKLNDALARNIELEEATAQYAMEEAFEEVAEGLAMTQSEKFRNLAEGVEFAGDLDAYKRKLNIIKEKHFAKPTASKQADVLEESFDGEVVEEEVVSSPLMKTYMQTISRTIKR